MSERGPDFDELVGRGLEHAERDRLQRVHELLLEVGPPPEISAELAAPPTPATVHPLRPRRGALVAIAAALGVLVFALGILVSDGSEYGGTFRIETMTGTTAAESAHATIQIFDADAAGNWPMEIEVTGLGPPASGGVYELWLTRGERRVALCGSFLADTDGSTTVPMNAPWRLDRFDGWVVVEEGSDVPLLTT